MNPPAGQGRLPPFYGDGFGEYQDIAIDELALTETLYGWLKRWAEGDFVTGERRKPPRRLEDLPLAAQPGALDRTPLEDCLGGPFHPGIEMTWPMRVPRMWRPPGEAHGLPFRLRILSAWCGARDDFGPVLTPEVCIGPDGPLAASGPGSLTRWLGVPWQTDEASCLSGYDSSTYLPVPSFWAARVPNEVLSEHAYRQSTDRRLPYVQRLKSAAYRQFWLRDLQGSSYQARINNMVKEWSLLGIVAEQNEPAGRGEPGLPGRAWVETAAVPLVQRRRSDVAPAPDGGGDRADDRGSPKSRPPRCSTSQQREGSGRRMSSIRDAATSGGTRGSYVDSAPHLAIVGGGPAGAVAALVAARRGLRVTLLEASPRT